MRLGLGLCFCGLPSAPPWRVLSSGGVPQWGRRHGYMRVQPSARRSRALAPYRRQSASRGEPWRASGEGMHAVATQSAVAPQRHNVAHGGAKAQLRRLAGGAWSLGAVHPARQHSKEAVFVDTAEPQLSEAARGHTDGVAILLDETRGGSAVLGEAHSTARKKA